MVMLLTTIAVETLGYVLCVGLIIILLAYVIFGRQEEVATSTDITEQAIQCQKFNGIRS